MSLGHKAQARTVRAQVTVATQGAPEVEATCSALVAATGSRTNVLHFVSLRGDEPQVTLSLGS